ncbi:hypothetical protein O1611_g562 [Lasiodiplodia mahajangana]|uniref:Uncharacterized protein n=1 Tax=Lasiodiplodia mahajangana TaxID=1108764 RepID=A0ACC2JZZ9_9PEZI|nr:hypothetical protein O1611_g562 [Lasiodiplodia mahajangana]
MERHSAIPMEQGYIIPMDLVVSSPEKAVQYTLPNDLESLHVSKMRRTETDNPDYIASTKPDNENTSASGEPDNLDTIVKSIDAILDHSPIQTAPLNDLVVRLLSVFENTSDMKYLDEAISAVQEAAARFSSDSKDPRRNTNRKRRLSPKRNMRKRRKRKKREDLDAAIANVVKAVKDNSDCYVDEAVQLGNLSRMRLMQHGLENCLKEVILNARKASSVVPSTSPYRSFLLANLGDALFWKYRETKDAGALIEAIDVTMQAIHLGYEFEPSPLTFKWKKIIEDAKEGISPGRKLLLPNFKGYHPELAVRLDQLGLLMELRWMLGGTVENLDASIRLSSVVSDHSHLDPICGKYVIHIYRGIENKSKDRLAEAVSSARKEEAGASRKGPSYSFKVLGRVAGALYEQYRKTSDVAVLEEAISEARKAVQLALELKPYLREIIFPEPPKERFTEQEDAKVLSMCLSILSKMLRKRYQVIGNPVDLDEAILASRNAIRVFRYKENKLGIVKDEARHLANMLLIRYEELGQEEDGENAFKLIFEVMHFAERLHEHIEQRKRIMLL